MLGFAFVFAPIAFHTIGPTPQFAATIAACVEALTSAGYVLAAIAALASLPQFRSHPRTCVAVIALLAIMTLLGAYETHALVPLMQHTALQTPAYDALHRRSSGVYSAILLAGIAAFIVAAASRTARRAASSR
jgi:hypothetical protein